MRKNRHKNGTSFYCFSPPVMLATFIIEISLLFYVVFRYKLNTVTRLIALQLVSLALFQLAEFNVCERSESGVDMWSRLGFVAITMLPVLGMHLVQAISGRGWFWLKWLAYASAALWIGVFALNGHAFDPHVCGGNYIIFDLVGWLGGAFYVYYYFWLVTTMLFCAYFARKAASRIRRSLHLIILGYCVFLVPTVLLNTFRPETSAGIPSIMCGFALTYAFILVFAILPQFKTAAREKK